MLLATCGYVYYGYPHPIHKCRELVPEGVDERLIHAGDARCIFHDIDYLEGDNYEKHKDEVARRFEEKLSEYSSYHTPLEFMGYRLPGVSFQSKQLNEALYFSNAIFYGVAQFQKATFSNEADFGGATFSNKAYFGVATFSNKAYFMGAKFFNEVGFANATFSNEANFMGAKFFNKADFDGSTFLSKAYFSGEFNGSTYFNYTIFKEPTQVTFDINDMSNVWH